MSEPFRGVVNLDIRGSTPDWAPFSQPVAHRGRRTWCTRCLTTSASGRWATAAPYRPTVATITGKGADSWPASSATAWLTHVLVEQHPKKERERVATEQLIGGKVLGDAELRHPGSVPHEARGRGTAPQRSPDSLQPLRRRGPAWPGAVGQPSSASSAPTRVSIFLLGHRWSTRRPSRPGSSRGQASSLEHTVDGAATGASALHSGAALWPQRRFRTA